ncbi:MAG: DUF1292 domain-containing protein [Lachnospiraceae bacterium]|jgi:uncharacterized protein YrzB (UPF0473 family)|nr:DUF1292 domain-containing protein [Lachnospiraceae bacterium]SDA61958.1 Protein of unknown function [Lachnospiraceae bacterium G11]MBO4809328.1 DUF1292 domain-containing protein [Lachnospiraceae bacterium]MBO7386878.1 DUF1292 domain-containing protein [Lachnospiraceae bacterium]MBP5299086.1 DUF1292 domain-containing protein [Lachnospiraceae bacterium]
MEKISFCSPEEGTVDLYVLEQTTIGGVNYILVTDTEEGDGEAFILKENPSSDDSENVYDIVEDDEELQAVGQVFGSLLEDVDLE